MRHLLWAIGALVLCCIAAGVTACATPKPEPQIVTQVVKVPVPVPCGVDPGPEPQYADTPDALKAAHDLFERVRLLLAGRDQRDARLAELKAASAGCWKP